METFVFIIILLLLPLFSSDLGEFWPASSPRGPAYMGQKSMTSVHFSRSQLLLCKKIQKLNCLYLQNLSCYCFLIYGMFSICKDLLEYVKILNVGQPEHGVMTTWHSWSFFLLRTRLKKQYKCWSETLWQVMPYGWGVCIIVFTCKFFNY